MKKLITPLLLLVLSYGSVFAVGNKNLENLITTSEWNSLFPNRAGINPGHVQGYTTDFYSYANLTTAADEMADYVVTITKKAGLAGQKTEVTRRSTGAVYVVSSVTSFWESQPVAEETVEVDFAHFINRSNDVNNKRELAAFLANISKETNGGWETIGSGTGGDRAKWGLYFVHETSTSSPYADAGSAEFPPTWGKYYYGRGPIQLTWNYNYGQFSKFLYNDKQILLDDPDALERDGVLALKSAIWFWMMPQCPKPSCHQVMHDLWTPEAGDYAGGSRMYSKGFAHTNNIINGGLECRSSSSSGFTEKVYLRSELFKYYMGIMGFSASDVAAENSGDYSTLCYESWSIAMTDYVDCSVTDDGGGYAGGGSGTGTGTGTGGSACSTPSLGDDQSICGSEITLSAGITLASGEAIKWYKDDVEISGETGTTYSTMVAGTYKAEVSGASCTTSSDAVVLTSSGALTVTASNGGYFCTGVGPDEVTITVTGGGGTYNMFDVASGGSPIKTGSSFTINGLDVADASSETYYIEEPAGELYTVGPSARWTVSPDAWNQYSAPSAVRAGFTWLDNRYVFTTASDMTLQSIDFDIAKGATAAQLVVEIYNVLGDTTTPIRTKTIDLEAIDYAEWDQEVYTASLNFELPAGQYAIDWSKSTCLMQVAMWTNGSGNTFDYLSWGESGIIAFDGSENRHNDWGLFTNHIWGAYNWKFSTGSGPSACGRTAVTVNNDCTTGQSDISVSLFNVFPNPAYDVINVAFKDVNAEGGVLELYNSVGQLVASQRLIGVGEIAQISTDDLNGGIYYVKLSADGKTSTSSVVVTK